MWFSKPDISFPGIDRVLERERRRAVRFLAEIRLREREQTNIFISINENEMANVYLRRFDPNPQLSRFFQTDRSTPAEDKSAGYLSQTSPAFAVSAKRCRDCRYFDRNFYDEWLHWPLFVLPLFPWWQIGHDLQESREFCYASVVVHNGLPTKWEINRKFLPWNKKFMLFVITVKT